jgi:GNAT superfamily N-acetyltransferase
MKLVIRKGTKEDIPDLLKLIRELARYEKAEHEVSNTPEMMLKDGFGDSPVFGSYVAEADGVIAGLSVYYYRYSTWKGKRIYLEDIIVTESHRGKGIGKLLFEEVMATVLREQCTGMMWQVLDWNEPAINFYKRFNTRFDGEWINCHLDSGDIIKLMNSADN